MPLSEMQRLIDRPHRVTGYVVLATASGDPAAIDDLKRRIEALDRVHEFVRRMLSRASQGCVLLRTYRGPALRRGDRELSPCNFQMHAGVRANDTWTTTVAPIGVGPLFLHSSAKVAQPGTGENRKRPSRVAVSMASRFSASFGTPPVLPSTDLKASAPRTEILSRLNSPAYVYPCKRFTATLTDSSA